MPHRRIYRIGTDNGVYEGIHCSEEAAHYCAWVSMYQQNYGPLHPKMTYCATVYDGSTQRPESGAEAIKRTTSRVRIHGIHQVGGYYQTLYGDVYKQPKTRQLPVDECWMEQEAPTWTPEEVYTDLPWGKYANLDC